MSKSQKVFNPKDTVSSTFTPVQNESNDLVIIERKARTNTDLTASYVFKPDSALEKDDGTNIDQWQKWQAILWNDPSLGEKVITSIVTKSRKDVRRFNIHYGSGKNA